MDQQESNPVKNRNTSRQVSAKNTQEEQTKPDNSFKRVFKGETEAVHDLFELEEANFKANKSWRFLHPEIVNVPHKHHFHTIDRLGRPQTVSSDNVGHFHYIEMHANPDGTMVAKCGPAMRRVIKRVKGKDKTIIEPVFYGAYKADELDEEGKPMATVDGHTHELKYLYAEKLKV